MGGDGKTPSQLQTTESACRPPKNGGATCGLPQPRLPTSPPHPDPAPLSPQARSHSTALFLAAERDPAAVGRRRAGGRRNFGLFTRASTCHSRSDVRGLRRVVHPLVVDVQREVPLVHDAHGNLLRLHRGEVVATAAAREGEGDRKRARERKKTERSISVFDKRADKKNRGGRCALSLEPRKRRETVGEAN